MSHRVWSAGNINQDVYCYKFIRKLFMYIVRSALEYHYSFFESKVKQKSKLPTFFTRNKRSFSVQNISRNI